MAKIVFWLGSAFETWDPRTAMLDRGIGGSEVAAICASRELAKLGHEVSVYADVPVQDRMLGVAWLPYRQALLNLRDGRKIECDLFVSSRVAEAKHKLSPDCRRAWLWMHDLHCGPDWENLIGGTYDRVICLSDWARRKFIDTYPGVDEARVALSRNGLDFARFQGHEDLRPGMQHLRLRSGQQPLTVIYSSSPDRGLDRLLGLWPQIRDMVGKLPGNLPPELHVYYGFENWKKLAALRGNTYIESQRIAALETKLATTEGVFTHGRVGQVELARAFLNSHLWLYPTEFPEISCITAMEAQAAGCKIVTTRFAALPETAPTAWFVDPPVHTTKYEKSFIEATWEALIDDTVMCGGEHLWSWAKVAEQWHGWLQEELA